MPMTPLSLLPDAYRSTLERFLRVLSGRNRAALTIQAYATDLRQFFVWLLETNATATAPELIERADVEEYLAHLAQRGISGLSRARKLAAIRELYRFLVDEGSLERSPSASVATPRRERHERSYLTRDEYNRLLASAGAHPRDFAILTLFLQTGIRVSELCALRLGDVDLAGRKIRVHGKGQVERTVELERKGISALKLWLGVRLPAGDDHLFLNYEGSGLAERSVKKLMLKYRLQAGITKKAGCHSLRHTFATAKAEQNVSPYQLKEWLGHAKLDTTMQYVHLAKGPKAQKVMEGTSL
jgi:integrase/recombinase XerC